MSEQELLGLELRVKQLLKKYYLIRAENDRLVQEQARLALENKRLRAKQHTVAKRVKNMVLRLKSQDSQVRAYHDS